MKSVSTLFVFAFSIFLFVNPVNAQRSSKSYGKIHTDNKDQSAPGKPPFWRITGNSNINDSTHFLGTINNAPLSFKVNNQPSGIIHPVITNTSFGYQSAVSTNPFLYGGPWGKHNTVMGYQALFSNSIGYGNTVMGYQGLYSNLLASENTAIGYQALYSNLYANGSTAVGYRTLRDNKGYGNSALGDKTLSKNIFGIQNTGMGQHALISNTDGTYNTAIGANALYTNINGHENVAIGYKSMFYNQRGSLNTAIGSKSLVTNTIYGSANVAIGWEADVSEGSIQFATALGSGAVANSNYKIRLGDGSVKVVESGVGSWTTADGRFESNITEEVKGLDFIKRLRPIVYNFELEKYRSHIRQNMTPAVLNEKLNNATSDIITIRQSGFIGQEVEKAIQESGYDFNGVHVPEGVTDNYSVSYERFVVPLVKAVQELALTNDSLKNQLATLQNELNEIKTQLTLLLPGGVANKNFLTNSGFLEQNTPNPVSGSTTIGFYIPAEVQNAAIALVDMRGNTKKTFPVTSKGKGQLTINIKELMSGNYSYVLYFDGRVIDSKKMVIIK